MIYNSLNKILLVSKKENQRQRIIEINPNLSITVLKFVTQIMGHQTHNGARVGWG